MSNFLNEFDSQFKLAAPSWVIPGTVAENCIYLTGMVDEVALLFFETESCLNYTEDDLSPELAGLGLTFHIHHPLDLPWADGGARVAEIVTSLNEKASHLSPVAHVVHPPAAGSNAAGLLRDFAEALAAGPVRPETVLIENIRENSLVGMGRIIRECGFKICLDLGHILAYAQHDILSEDGIDGLVGMLHLNAPGPKGRHLGLGELNDKDFQFLDVLLDLLDSNGTITVEVFEEKSFLKSLQFLSKYFHGKICALTL